MKVSLLHLDSRTVDSDLRWEKDQWFHCFHELKGQYGGFLYFFKIFESENRIDYYSLSSANGPFPILTICHKWQT